MCGICGDIRFTDSSASLKALAAMKGRMEARGPDTIGTYLQGRVGLGHTRLKIIDLTEQAFNESLNRTILELK